MFCLSKNKCCICLENKKVGIYCKYCREGIICTGCTSQVIETCLTCPICRQHGWCSTSKTKIIPVNNLLNVDNTESHKTGDKKCRQKAFFYWFCLIHILSSIFCICAVGYGTILIICSKDTVISLGNWVLLIAPVVGIIEISLFLLLCCKGCGYHTIFFPTNN